MDENHAKQLIRRTGVKILEEAFPLQYDEEESNENYMIFNSMLETYELVSFSVSTKTGQVKYWLAEYLE